MNDIKFIRCPKCGSDNYDCYDQDSSDGVHWEYYYCEDCEAEFDVKYVAIEIKLN